MVEQIGGRGVYVADHPLARESDVLDWIGDALAAGAEWVVLPVERLDPAFFRLSTGLAGAVLQKLTNYRLRVVVVGDIEGPVAASAALADFVRESNRGGGVWFVPDRRSFEQRLAAAAEGDGR